MTREELAEAVIAHLARTDQPVNLDNVLDAALATLAKPDGHEWSLVLDGRLGSLGEHHEMDGMTEKLAIDRLHHWRVYRPDVGSKLRRRERLVVLGAWEQVQP